jgi:hypothetical protein
MRPRGGLITKPPSDGCKHSIKRIFFSEPTKDEKIKKQQRFEHSRQLALAITKETGTKCFKPGPGGKEAIDLDKGKKESIIKPKPYKPDGYQIAIQNPFLAPQLTLKHW